MIRLRSLERKDLKQLRDWRNDPEVFSRVREYRFLNMENQEAWFKSLKDDRNTIMFGVEQEYCISLKDDEERWELIGVCGLTHIDWIVRKAEISIYIGDKINRGKGLGIVILETLAKYAFKEINLNRLWAEVFSNNKISIKLFEKCGYIPEGWLRNHAYKNGTYLDCGIMGLLQDEWQKKDAVVQ